MRIQFGNGTSPVRLSDKPRKIFQEASKDLMSIQFAGKTGLNPVEQRAQAFVAQHEPNLYKLGHESNLAAWNLYTQGRDEDITKSEATQKAYLAYTQNPAAFKEIAELHQPDNRKQITNRLLRRQIEQLYKSFFQGSLNQQLQNQIIEKQSTLDAAYNAFRVEYKGQKLSNSDVNELFKHSIDPAEVEALWKARHEVGNYRVDAASPSVAEQIIDLVKTRNQLARSAGYANYYDMALDQGDVDKTVLDSLMAQVKAATDAPFAALQKKVDAVVTNTYKVAADQVHLPWFQSLHALGSNPESGNMMRLYQYDYDAPFKGKDPVPLLEKTAQAMGTTIKDILAKSDLYYDPNRPKAQHWFCFGIDSPSDVRALENIDPQFQKRMGYAFSTSLHEVKGHGLDFAEIDPAMPSTLRDHHSITTESNAMLIENLVNDAGWFQKIMGLPEAEAKALSQKAVTYNTAQKLCNMRAMMATIDFERKMYALPDTDLTLNKLNDLWWQTQSSYLFEQKPAGRNNPDWARVPHYAGAPAYYHNYFIAELRRAQVLATINQQFAQQGGLLSPEAGEYLRQHRKGGLTYQWDEIIQRMTGKALGVDAFMQEIKPVLGP